MKRIVISLILVSMTLHCASRLGILSYLYDQRYDAAFALGVIDEKPIAVCDQQTDVHKDLYIAVPDSDDHLPAAISHAIEILLFFEPGNSGIPNATPTIEKHCSMYHVAAFETPSIPIFLPPKA